MVLYAAVVIVVPIVVTFGGGFLIYVRWFLPQRGRLAQEQLAKLKEARSALLTAVSQIESFEAELREKSSQAERLQQELDSLKTLNAETAADLEKKLKALELVNRNRIWFERLVAFLIGVISSLSASYVWQQIHAPSVISSQSNPALHTDARGASLARAQVSATR
jgi:ABC-type multidrug transport system fused ATPase/permease subunit